VRPCRPIAKWQGILTRPACYAVRGRAERWYLNLVEVRLRMRGAEAEQNEADRAGGKLTLEEVALYSHFWYAGLPAGRKLVISSLMTATGKPQSSR